jgi:hypothetical protein
VDSLCRGKRLHYLSSPVGVCSNVGGCCPYRNREFEDLRAAILKLDSKLHHLKWMPDLVVRAREGCCVLFLEEYKSAISTQNDRFVVVS